MISSQKNNLLNIDFLLEKLKIEAGFKIADLGCGRFGYFTFPLAKKVGRNGKVYAVDIIKDNLNSIKSMARTENLSQIETIWSDLEVYKGAKINNNSLDAVLLISVLHQAKKPLQILEEASRMVKIGGKILVLEWLEDNTVFGTKDSPRIGQKELKGYASKLFLGVQEEFLVGDHYYALLLIKK